MTVLSEMIGTWTRVETGALPLRHDVVLRCWRGWESVAYVFWRDGV